MELIKKRIHYVREGKKIFDQFYVDEDYNVPEAKEDVRRIVDTGTELKIEEIRPVEIMSGLQESCISGFFI